MASLDDLLSGHHGRWHDLMLMILAWTYWHRPYSELQRLWEVIDKSDLGELRKVEVRKMAQTIAEALVAEGRREGEKLALRRLLRKQLEHKFSHLPDDFLNKIDHIDDIDKLEMLAVQITTISSLPEFQFTTISSLPEFQFDPIFPRHSGEDGDGTERLSKPDLLT